MDQYKEDIALKTTITFRNIDHTEALDDKIQSKSAKLERFLGPDSELNWVSWVENDVQISEARLHHRGEHYIAKSSDKNLYHTFDQVIDKLEAQITKEHSKSKDKHHQKVSSLT